MSKKAFKAEDAVIIYLIGFLAYQIFGFMLMALIDTESNLYIYLAYLIPQVCYISATGLYAAVGKKEFRLLPKKEAIKPIHFPLAVLVGLGLFFCALLPNYGLQKLFQLMGKAPTVTVPDIGGAGDVVLTLLIMCFLPAVGEELVFRKNFCDGFSSYGGVAAILLSGFIFGLSHLNLAQTVYQVILGCVLSYLYMKTQNITLTSIIHFINNALAVFLTGITGEDIWNNIVTLGISFAVGAVAVALGIWLFNKTSQRLSREKGAKPSWFVKGFVALLVLLWIVAAIVV